MNNDNNSGLSAFVMSAIPLKFKLYILAGILIFFFVVLVPVLIVTGAFGGSDDDVNSDESSESSSSEGGTTGTGEIKVISKDGLTFPKVGGKVRYTFCYPVSDFKAITGTFGSSGSSWENKHTGTDFVGKTNCSVVAVADGVVNYAGYHKSYGNYCIVMHIYMVDKEVLTFYTQYCHMQTGSITVSKGDKVVQGQKLGVQGATGNVTGAHCHFEFSFGPPSASHQLYSTTKDPLTYIYAGKVFDGKPKIKQKYWEQSSSSQSKPQMMKPTN